MKAALSDERSKDNSPRTFGREMEYSYTNKNTMYHMQDGILI